MSGIAGIISFGDKSPASSQIEAMTGCLERRGPDGTHVVVERQMAFGHTLLATTPEALVERLPLADALTGCTITADARIDNRDELMNALCLTEEKSIGDGELILRAYLQWGEHCATKLLGDFAFAIWDPRSSSLLCGRDQVGMRQLIYHHDAGNRFIFATEAGAILALEDIQASLNHDRIGDYLSNMEGADFTSTFFRDIHRLPPAHILRADRSGIILRRYWQLTREPTLKLASDRAYAEAFLAIFTEAVRCRLRSPGPVGAMVSGGMDSNAVASVAASLLAGESRGPLATFSAIGPSPSECVETQAIETALQSPNFVPTTVCHAALEPLHAELAFETSRSAEPFDGDMGIIRAVYLAARIAGIKTVLDGVESDVVLSSRFHMAFLLREGRFLQVLRETKGAKRFRGPRFRMGRALVAAAWQAYVPMPIRAIRFKRGRRKADSGFRTRASAVVPSLDLPRALSRRRHVQRRDFENDRVDALTKMRVLTNPNVVVVRERYDRVAGAFGIEPRDPFLDLRLIRFCLSLPREQLTRNGWPKWILRQAMAGLVPPAIRWRRGKEHLGPEFTRAIMGMPAPTLLRTSPAAELTRRNERIKEIYLSNWFAYHGKRLEVRPSKKKGLMDDKS